MNIFEQQRHKILNDYLRSPRCIKAKPSKPNNQFHSWKNYLNTDINTLCNKIRNSKPSASKSQYQYTNQNQIKEVSSLEYKDRQVEMVENYQICNFNDEAEQQQENRNCYSKVQVLANNVHKHRHSNSSFAGQKKDEKYVAKSTTPTSEMEGFSSRSQGLESINYSPFSESVKTKFMSTSESQNRQNVNWGKKSNRNTFYSTVSSVQKTVKRREMDEDTYHQQLKQAERLYLLQKFVEHYESIHNFKM